MLKTASIFVLSLALTSTAASAGTVVYQNDFATNTSGWTASNTSTTPTGGNRFLGEFGWNNQVQLKLNGLAPHTQVTLEFDVYAIRSVDGNGPEGGHADTFEVRANSTSLLLTSFANYGGTNTQAFGGYDTTTNTYLTGGTYAPQTGAAATNSLGYQYNGHDSDSTYHLTFTINDTSSAITFNFLSNFSENPSNESWGLDNVTVSTSAVAVPLPAAFYQGGILLALAGAGIFLKKRLHKLIMA